MFKSILEKLDWKKIALKIWEDTLPKLEKLVESTDNQFDDATLKAVKHLVEKFLHEEEMPVEEAKEEVKE